MKEIVLHDKTFTKSITVGDIYKRVRIMGKMLAGDLSLCQQKPVFLVTLNGAFMFAADLFREMDLLCDIKFIQCKSYEGTKCTGFVDISIPISEDIRGRDVVILEDIIDTGETIKNLCRELNRIGTKSIRIVSLLFKESAYKYEGQYPISHVGFRIPDDFVVGYGMDYNGLGRHLPEIYTLKN